MVSVENSITRILTQPGIVSCFTLEPDAIGRFGGEVGGERGSTEASADSKVKSTIELSGTAKSETVGELGRPIPESAFATYIHQGRDKMHDCSYAPGPRSLKQLENGVWSTKM